MENYINETFFEARINFEEDVFLDIENLLNIPNLDFEVILEKTNKLGKFREFVKKKVNKKAYKNMTGDEKLKALLKDFKRKG